jgi:integrase
MKLFLFNLDTGLRLSEILAIKWEDIDLKKKTVIINKNLVEAKNRSKNQRGKLELIVQNTTKTENGKRILPLTERTIRMLKEYKLKSQKKSEIVFCSQNDTYVRPRNYKRTFYKIIENASIEKCGAHTLRHTYATRLFEANIDAKVVSELLGHKDISVTLNTYVHVLKSKKREAIRALDELISGVK